jgi:hypothetical protein
MLGRRHLLAGNDQIVTLHISPAPVFGRPC